METVQTTDQTGIAMSQFEADRELLAKELETLFDDLMREALQAVELCVPEYRQAGSADAKLHAAARSRILTVANGKKRHLPKVLKNYAVQQVYVSEQVVRQVVNTPVKLRTTTS